MTDLITQACPKCPTTWTARELLPCPECGYTFPSRLSDCDHCGGHPAGVGDGKPCPTCGSPGMHASGCAVNNGPALPVGPCDCGAVEQQPTRAKP